MGNEEKNAVLRVLDSDKLSTFVGAAGNCFMGGEEVKNFENIWASTYGFNHAVSVNSWTTGLQVAVGAIGIGPGDEVICPPYTMSASASAVLFYGGIPIFADIDQKIYYRPNFSGIKNNAKNESNNGGSFVWLSS